jgi:FtsH ternary system domain X6
VEAGAAVNEVKSVSRFEADLLCILRFVLGTVPAAQGWPLIVQRCDRPRCLSRAAVELVQDTLAKGCVRLLARHGGWRRERFLRINQIADGRLWQRTPPAELGLHFSRHTLELLIWLTAENPCDGKARRRVVPDAELTPADGLVCYHVLVALLDLGKRDGSARSLGFSRQSLCRLAFPGVFAAQPNDQPLDCALWTQGVGACILETMQDELKNRWLALERSKKGIADWQQMQALGQKQDKILRAFLGALENTGRQDLARFLLMALEELLPEGVRAADWVGNLTTAGPRLADRAATSESALVVVRQLQRFERWQRQARDVGYFDENYAASQLWKSDWEHWHGDQLCRRAEGLFRELSLGVGEGAR